MGVLVRFCIVLLLVSIVPASLRAEAQATTGSLPVEIVPSGIGHSSAVTAVAFSPDGRRLLSGSEDKTLKLWDVATGRLVRTFEGHSEPVTSIAFSPDGTKVLSGSSAGGLTGSPDNTLKLWDAATGKLVRTFEGAGNWVSFVAFSVDGTKVLSGNQDATQKLWETATGKLIRTFEGDGHQVLSPVAFSLDGTKVLEGSGDNSVADNPLKLWDVTTGKIIRTFKGVGKWVSSIVFSPDGTKVLSGSSENTLKLWDSATGRLIRTFEGAGFISRVSFSPDGTKILSGSPDNSMSGNWDNALKLWDMTTGRLIRTFEGAGDSVSPIVFSPDGTKVLAGNLDGTLNLWNAGTGKLVRTFDGNGNWAWSAAFSPDGHSVLSGYWDKTLKLWDAKTGRSIRMYEGHGGGVISAVFSHDGRSALSGSYDQTLKLWDVATGRLNRTFEGRGEGLHSSVFLPVSVAFSPDDRSVLAAGPRFTPLKLWDTATGRLLRTFGREFDQFVSVAFSPDGHSILSGTDDRAELWDVATGRLLRTFGGHGDAPSFTPTPNVTSVAFSPEGRSVLSGYDDGTLRLWNTATGELIRTFDEPPGTVKAGQLIRTDEELAKSVDSLAFSSDGKRILSGSINGRLKIWETISGRLFRGFEAFGSVTSASFSPDGANIVASSNGQIKIWRTETGELIANLIAMADGEWVTITPEGFFDASANGAQALTVVRGLEVYAIDQVYQVLYRPDLVREKLVGDPQGKVRDAAAKLDLAKVIASGAAPRVAITAPRPDSKITEEQTDVEAAITDQGGGIGKVEWRINGVTLGIEERGLGPAEQSGSAGRVGNFRRTLSLDLGDNLIEITAYNAKGLIASLPVSLKITRAGAANIRPRLYVLAVGIDDYWDGRLRLVYAAPDATALGEALRRAGDKLYDQVEVTTLLDAEATTANLDRTFIDLGKKVRAEDVFVFFVAGHGKTIDGRYYFLPQEFHYEDENSIPQHGIGQDRWQDWFAQIKARKSILLYDTCESGSLTGEKVAQRGLEQVEEQKTALDRLTRATGRTVLTASTDDAPALEGYHGHGVFTYALLDALGRAGVHGDGLVYVTELASYVDRKVPELSYAAFHVRQVPQMNIRGQDFPVARRITLLLDDAPVVSKTPAKPTHVVIARTAVRQSANASAPIVLQLQPGAQIELVKTAGGWVLVARDGKNLGYVEEKALARLQ